MEPAYATSASIREEVVRTPSPGVGVLLKQGRHSPIPAASMSSNSTSPGSASDHMGAFPHPPNPFLSSSATTGSAAPTTTGMVTANVPRVVSTLSSGTEATNSSNSLQGQAAMSTSSFSGNNSKPTATRRRQTTKIRSGSDRTEPTRPNRRQKRLERNRESARLSRRRRKQYLEVLEDKVTQLGHDMDQGRREHVAQTISTMDHKRRELLEQARVESLPLLESGLSRTSQELMLTNTFQSQQLKSFSLPPSTKFLLWLTLQNDVFFRGGRASSERLSAARIGERMLNSGTNRVPPSQSMWPLFCNEVGLSYDQEEKVRSFQRVLLQTQESWLDRHTAFASSKVISSLHDATQALTLRVGQRERSGLSVLNEEQRIKFLAWSMRNRDRVFKVGARLSTFHASDDKYQTSTSQHVAANLYILNHRLENILEKIPRAAPLVTGAKLKKLSRRPLFESLGCMDDKPGKGDGKLSRENSFASSGSLKRSASDLSMVDANGEDRQPSISPEEAQATCAPIVERTLGFVKEIIPLPPTPSSAWEPVNIPNPTPVTSFSSMPDMSMAGAPESKHARKSSFLPAHLNVVPEEMWNADVAEDFLMNLVDEDWAIGEGVGMEF